MHERQIVNASIVLTVLLVVATVLAYFFVLPPQIPLFYTSARPQDQLAEKIWIFIIPAFAVFITAIQAPFVRVRDTVEHNTTVRIFTLGSMFLLLLLGITLIRIFFLVT